MTTLRALCVHAMETQPQSELTWLPLQLREEFGRRRRAARTIDRFTYRLFRTAERWAPDTTMNLQVRQSTGFETWFSVTPVGDCQFQVISCDLHGNLNETMSRLRLAAWMARLETESSALYVYLTHQEVGYAPRVYSYVVLVLMMALVMKAFLYNLLIHIHIY
jgi:hypothetical protein